jgi:hypothetical protein
MSKVRIDNFIVEVLAFIADIHDCHKCKYPQGQISGRNGRHRTFCTKYGLPIQRVHWNCIDRFGGFNEAEIQEIKRQHKAGKCTLVIDGVAV